MSQNNRNTADLHPYGKRLIAIRDVQRVYQHGCEIPYRLYLMRGGKSTSMVTAQQVREASDRWDAESVLEDIDTQWGTLPNGGALEGYGS
ncbi:hypothetical protein L227DRAFT_576565, partial [Lentinus tigrinus ALCF2SS1-6]